MLPPAPVQVRVYVVLLPGETDTVPPEAEILPAPLSILAEVLLVQEAVRLVELPAVMLAGEAERVAVGAADPTVYGTSCGLP